MLALKIHEFFTMTEQPFKDDEFGYIFFKEVVYNFNV